MKIKNERKSNLQIQDLIGLTAVIVATAAAFAAIYQTRLMAEHQAVSVWPYMQMWAGIAPDAEDRVEQPPFAFNLANKGVGPAIIEDIEFRRKGQSYSSIREILIIAAKENGINPDVTPLNISEANVDGGEVVEAGEIRWIIQSQNRTLAQVMGKELYGEQSLEVDVCYCSLYKECWRLVFPNSRPQYVKTCR